MLLSIGAKFQASHNFDHRLQSQPELNHVAIRIMPRKIPNASGSCEKPCTRPNPIILQQKRKPFPSQMKNLPKIGRIKKKRERVSSSAFTYNPKK